MSRSSARQGKAQAQGCWIRPEKRLAIYLRDGFTCVYCEKNLHGAAPQDITLDHVLPRSMGGSNESSNLITACKRCNCARGNKPVADFAPLNLSAIFAQLHTPLAGYLPLARALRSSAQPVAITTEGGE